jgi:Ca2+-binding RTX toxin-like protein
MAELKSTTLTAGGTFNAQDAGTTNPQYQWTVYGNTGTEAITLNNYGGSAYGYGGNDTVIAVGLSTVYGGDGVDSVLSSGANTIYGEAGADVLTLAAGATGNSTLYGGIGADDIYITGSGNNTVYGDADNDNISLAAGTSGANVVYGGAGADRISVAVGTIATTLSGGAGNDTIEFTTGAGVNKVLFNAGDGADSIGAGFDLADDKISFGFTASQLAGATLGFGATPSITIGTDSVTLTDAIANAAALAAATNAAPGLFTGSEGKNIVYTSAGTANTKAAAADAYVIGADANATFTYNSTAQKYFGISTASASDVITATAETSAVTIDLTDAKYSSIEQAVGGSGADVLRGLATADALTGGAGADSIWGRGGVDALTGGTGDDVFYVGIGDGADVIADATGGANGQDTIKLYNVAKTDVTISATGGGADTTLTFTGGDSVTLTGGEAAAYGTKAAKYVLSDGSAMRIGSQVAGNIAYDSTVGYYWGSKSSVLNYGVTAAAETTGQTINLSDATKYNNIHVAIGSATAANTLRGTTGKDTMQGGSAADAFWGGTGGVDSMDLGVDNAADTVWFGKTDGDDSVKNADSSDRIKLWNVALSDIAGFATAAGDLVMTFKNNSVDRLTLQGGLAPTFELQDGSTFTVSTDGVYSSTAAFYAGGQALVTATAQTSGVILDLGDTVKYQSSYANVTGGSGADTLRGNSAANNVIGGSGADLIWGAGGADNLTGGTGTDTFYWGSSDANDIITDGEAGESVMLYTSGLTTAGVTAALGGGNMVLTSTFTGNTLTINNFNTNLLNKFVFGYSSTAANTYKLVDDGAGSYSFQLITA